MPNTGMQYSPHSQRFKRDYLDILLHKRSVLLEEVPHVAQSFFLDRTRLTDRRGREREHLRAKGDSRERLEPCMSS